MVRQKTQKSVNATVRRPAVASTEPLQISVSARDFAVPTELTDTESQKKPGIIRRILLYLGAGIVGIGVGAAASEAIDQTSGSRKGRNRFNAGKVLAAGGKAMVYAVAVILFVIIYPFYYAGTEAWYWYLDDSALSISMSELRPQDIVHHETFPNERLNVIAEADGCVYVFSHSKNSFIQVKETDWDWIFGGDKDVITTCLRDIREELASFEYVQKLEVWFREGAMIAQATARDCYMCSEYYRPHKIRTTWNLADLGVPSSVAGRSTKAEAKFELLELSDNGNVLAREKSTGRTIKFGLNSTSLGGVVGRIVDRALSPEGTMLAVTVKRFIQNSLWIQLFGDCEINMGLNKRGSYYSVPCEYSTEVWDIERQELLQTIYWPPGIKSLVFSGDSKWLMGTAYDYSELFGGTSLKFWELEHLRNS